MNPALIAAVTTAFENSFGAAPTLFVQAPGRVNLIGEHTDYNDGFVLPCAINHGTVIAAAQRNDGLVRVVAADYGNTVDQFRLDAPIEPHATELWPNYVRGVVKYLLEHGLALQGADLAVSGDVPQGAGLSSSASLEVAVAQAFKSLQGWTELQPTDMALIAQRAENRFVGCNCGIMDQLISARGQAGHALLIDCRSLDARAVPMPPGVAVMIVNSRVQRGLVESAYNIRRQQCEVGAAHFGVPALRDATHEMLETHSAGIDPLVLRRARHIVTENQRTLDACEALSRGDMQRMGVLMAESHASMRDDFEITVPAIDQLVQLLQDAIGAHGGARMTGGGFGGCVVALLPEAMVAEVRAVVDAHYRSPNGLPGDVYVCLPSAGASAIA